MIEVKAGHSGFVLTGPYRRLDPGSYVVRFTIIAATDLPSSMQVILCDLDVVTDSGQTTLGRMQVDGSALRAGLNRIDVHFALERSAIVEYRLASRGTHGFTVLRERQLRRVISADPTDDVAVPDEPDPYDWRRVMLPFPDQPRPKPAADIVGLIHSRGDPVRDYAVALALQTIRLDGIAGAMAEVGVYRGEMATFYHRVMPERALYLFDTFEGFPKADLEVDHDERFADTSLEAVKSRFPTDAKVIFRPGYFPATAQGLERERFAFVMLDVDLHKPTLAGLDWFYRRMPRGGYIFVHDYTSHESGGGISRAVDAFMADKPELLIHLPDAWGSILFRRM
jgi:O-methyltransferase